MSHLREGGKWILGMVLLLGGCCSSDCCPRLEPPSLPIVERGRLVLDVSALPPVDSSSRPELYPKTIYQKLTAEECACRAGQTAGLAAVLQQEQQARGCSGSCHGCLGGRKRSRLSETILALSADEARNKVVGEALETFYQLAEAEARMDLLQESLDEALALQRDTEQRVKRKLQKATDLDAVQKLASETRSDMGQLRQTRAQLNEHLTPIIALP